MTYPERALPAKRKKRKKRKDKSWAFPTKASIRKADKLLTEPFDIATGKPVSRKTTVDDYRLDTQHIILVGDIVTGFEAYGPFDSGHDAITWKQSTGPRELCQGQWYLMQVKPPIPGKD